MFKLISLEGIIRIPPEKFGNMLENIAYEELKVKYEGKIEKDLGFIIAITNVNVNNLGRIIPGDGATFNEVSFSILSYMPEVQEIVEGEVVEIEDFGAFVRIGPIDALLHVSQVIDDYVSYDEKQGTLFAKETARILKQGDEVRARITVVSFSKGGKIGITMRQPFLGKKEWILEEVQKSNIQENKK